MYAQPSSTVAGREGASEARAANLAGHGYHADHTKRVQTSAEAPQKPPADWQASVAAGGNNRGNEASEAGGVGTSWSGSSATTAEERKVSKDAKDSGGQEERPGRKDVPAHGPLGLVQDPFLRGVNCYAEVFLEVPDTTLSGIVIDPKAVTVYPTTRVHGGVTVQKEVLTGKYVIWNMAGEVRGHYSGLAFDDDNNSGPVVAPGADDDASGDGSSHNPSPVDT